MPVIGGPATGRHRLAGLDVTSRGGVMVITGEFDQAALYGLQQRIRLLGLDVVEARRVSGPPRRAAE